MCIQYKLLNGFCYFSLLDFVSFALCGYWSSLTIQQYPSLIWLLLDCGCLIIYTRIYVCVLQAEWCRLIWRWSRLVVAVDRQWNCTEVIASTWPFVCHVAKPWPKTVASVTSVALPSLDWFGLSSLQDIHIHSVACLLFLYVYIYICSCINL